MHQGATASQRYTAGPSVQTDKSTKKGRMDVPSRFFTFVSHQHLTRMPHDDVNCNFHTRSN